MSAADDVAAAAQASPLFAKYGTRVDAQSARELLAARIAQPASPSAGGSAAPAPAPTSDHAKAASAVGAGAEAINDFLKSSTGKTITREVVRGVFGLLKKH